MQILKPEQTKQMEELTEKLKDHKWRLNNLYFIRDERGNKVQFKLNETQDWLCDNMWYMNIIVKARQLGCTTFFTIFYLDQVLFSENKIAGIIAHRQEDMKRIFRGKILFALKNLHPWMQKYIGEPVIETANELTFKNGGEIFVSMTTRSQTPNFLHISEYGYICAHTPDKAEEILHGAINSVHAGQMVSIESTAEGREGHYYRLAMDAEKKQKEGRALTPLDFKIFFFPWWNDKRYILKDTGGTQITKEYKEYFTILEDKYSIKLSPEQQLWYVKKREMMGDGIFKEFPATLDEAFAVTLEGAYYAKEMARVYQERRIGFFPVDPLHDVNIAWDLGMNDQNVLIFFQEIGPEIRFVDSYSNSGYGLEHYVNYIKSKGYRLGRNVLPHDVAVRDLSTGISREQFLWDLGLRNTVVVPKGGIADGIEKVRQLFPRFRFHEETTKIISDSLYNYRRDFDKNMGVWKNTPRHDESSHVADAIRTMAMSHQETLMMEGEGGVNIQSCL
jgi:hypothetical protein